MNFCFLFFSKKGLADFLQFTFYPAETITKPAFARIMSSNLSLETLFCTLDPLEPTLTFLGIETGLVKVTGIIVSSHLSTKFLFNVFWTMKRFGQPLAKGRIMYPNRFHI